MSKLWLHLFECSLWQGVLFVPMFYLLSTGLEKLLQLAQCLIWPVLPQQMLVSLMGISLCPCCTSSAQLPSCALGKKWKMAQGLGALPIGDTGKKFLDPDFGFANLRAL